jgi:hypothetical protein
MAKLAERLEQYCLVTVTDLDRLKSTAARWKNNEPLVNGLVQLMAVVRDTNDRTDMSAVEKRDLLTEHLLQHVRSVKEFITLSTTEGDDGTMVEDLAPSKSAHELVGQATEAVESESTGGSSVPPALPMPLSNDMARNGTPPYGIGNDESEPANEETSFALRHDAAQAPTSTPEERATAVDQQLQKPSNSKQLTRREKFWQTYDPNLRASFAPRRSTRPTQLTDRYSPDRWYK